MAGTGSACGGGDEPFTGRAAIGYDHGYDGEVLISGSPWNPAYIEGFVEDCLERIGEDDPEGEWEEGDREMALEVLEAECEVRTGRPAGF